MNYPIFYIIVLAIIARIIANPFSNVLQKQLTQKGQHPLVINLISYSLLALISMFIVFDVSFHQLPSSFWIYSIGGGITGALGNGFIIKALEKGDLSVLGPINAYKSVIGMIFAFILIGEIPNLGGLLGVALIIIGSYFVLDTTQARFTWKLFKEPAIQYRIGALVLTGIQAVLDKKIIAFSSLEIAFAGWSIFGALFSFLFILFTPINLKKEFYKINKPAIGKYILLVLSIGVMLASTNFALQNMPVGYVLALFQLSIILSVILGNKFFNEGHLVKKLIGSLIMIGGSLMILYYQ